MPRRNSWRCLLPSLVEHHAHREARPVDAFHQRAQIGRQSLRQHRHDAVGEIGRVAALVGFAVERRARRHVMRHVGDGDDGDMAARVARIVVGPGPHRVVMVARVFRIDGDERDVAQIGAAARIGGRGARSASSSTSLRKFGRDAVRVDRDQADRFRRVHAAEPLDHARAREARGAAGQRFGQHKFVVLPRRRGRVPRRRIRCGSCGRWARCAPPAAAVATDAQHLVRAGAEPLDDARFVAVFGLRAAARARARRVRAPARFASRPGSTKICGGSSFDVPALRAREQFAVGILAGDFQHGDFGQGAGLDIAALAVAALTAPSLSSSFRMRFSAMRSAPLTPSLRAMSRLVACGLSASASSTRALSSGCVSGVLRPLTRRPLRALRCLRLFLQVCLSAFGFGWLSWLGFCGRRRLLLSAQPSLFFFLPPPLAARSAISASACSSVTSADRVARARSRWSCRR